MSITVLLFNILYVSEHYQLQSTSINCTVRNPGGILESFFSFKSNSVAHTVDSCSRTHVIFTNFFPLPLCMLVPQSCLTLQYHGLCNIMDWGQSVSSVHGIFQARIPEWVAIPFSRGSSWPRDQTWISHIAGSLFTVWATWEDYLFHLLPPCWKSLQSISYPRTESFHWPLCLCSYPLPGLFHLQFFKTMNLTLSLFTIISFLK